MSGFDGEQCFEDGFIEPEDGVVLFELQLANDPAIAHEVLRLSEGRVGLTKQIGRAMGDAIFVDPTLEITVPSLRKALEVPEDETQDLDVWRRRFWSYERTLRLLVGEETPLTNLLRNEWMIADMQTLQREVLSLLEAYEGSEEGGVGSIIGDDVSARVPTLITHNFLRLVHASGKIGSVPRTFFVSSGRHPHTRSDEEQVIDEQKWQDALKARAAKIASATRWLPTLLITERIDTGVSLERLLGAFAHHEVRAVPVIANKELYLNKRSDRVARRAVGVEKQIPHANTCRTDNFNAVESAQLRRFLHDYSADLFYKIFREDPPEQFSVAPVFTDQLINR